MGLRSHRHLLLVCAFAATMSFALAAHAQPRGDRSFPWGLAEGRLMVAIAEDLGLADDTLAAIKAAAEEQKTAETPISKERSEALKKLTALLDEGLPSEEAVLEASRGLGESTKKLRDLRLQYTRKVRGLLTAEELESYMLRRKSVPIPSGGARRR